MTSGAFASLFGAAPDVVADAPGRVNLLGEHTDYHRGFVLPMITPERTRCELRARGDRRVRAWSAAYRQAPVEYELGSEERRRDWADYLRGVTRTLASGGASIGGFDVRIESDVPVGAGLSSSAALEVSLVRALRSRFALDLDDLDVAAAAHTAETDFVGAPVGLMDQMAASIGRPRHALFLDTRSLEYAHIPWVASADLAAIDSAIPHAHATGRYAERRQQSFAAAERLGITALRAAGLDDIPRIECLPDPLDRRARHVVTENARVLAGVDALRTGDAPALGRLFNASHASLRDDYDVSLPDIDALVRLAQHDPSVYGARLTGGGFGGSVIVIARAGEGADAAGRVTSAYSALTGREARAFLL
ncbi:MAG TPA: galactokinase [Vicinamibacterales bacterium]